MRNNNIINRIATSVIAVYLIHDHPLIRDLVLKDIFTPYKYANSENLIVHMIISVLVIFISCTIIDQILKLLLNIIKKIYNKTQKQRILVDERDKLE